MLEQLETHLSNDAYLCKLTSVGERQKSPKSGPQGAHLEFTVDHGPNTGELLVLEQYESHLVYQSLVGRTFYVQVAASPSGRGKHRYAVFFPAYCRLMTPAEVAVEKAKREACHHLCDGVAADTAETVSLP